MPPVFWWLTHRLSTVQNADCVCVLANHRIVESGTHAELMGRGNSEGAVYHALVKRQLQQASTFVTTATKH